MAHGAARDELDRLQKERIALLDGFDDKRTGLVDVWLACNAILKVTATEDGRIKAEGWTVARYRQSRRIDQVSLPQRVRIDFNTSHCSTI